MLLPFDTIVRSIDFDERAAGMQLRPWQWEFLLGADGRTRLGDLARLCGIDFETAADLVSETEALGLVEIVTLSLDGYRALAAQLVTPIAIASPTTMAPPAAPALESAPFASVAAAATNGAPTKAVSVSFDSFSTMMTDWSAPVVEAAVAAPIVHEFAFEPEHDLFAARPTIDSAPFDFEFPNHMEPLAEHEPDVAPAPVGNYSDLFADPVSEVEHVDHVDHVAAEPIVAAAPIPDYPKKGVSFSLSADSFGLPSEPFDTPSLDAHTEAHAEVHTEEAFPESAIAFESEAPYLPPTIDPPKKDDVLLQHFQVADEPHAAPDASPATGFAETRTNGDLTGTVLRVLGLKK